MNEPLLKIQGLSFSVGDAVLLEDISIDVNAGEYVAIIGPNGAGKTTLVKCINRIHRPASGKILLAGSPIDTLDQRQLAATISYIPQSDAGFSGFSVYEFVMMGRYPHFRRFMPPSAEDHQAVLAALERLRIADFRHRPVTTLSGGERQKVLIAAALAQSSEILLLDEPTTFLDSSREAEITDILNSLNRHQGSTIIKVTHDLNVAMQHSTRILLLKNGRRLYYGPPGDVLDSSLLDEAFETRFRRISHPDSGSPLLIPEHYL